MSQALRKLEERLGVALVQLRGLKRNAAVVLGNVGTADDVNALTRALDDEEPLVRAHAAWALGRVTAPPLG